MLSIGIAEDSYWDLEPVQLKSLSSLSMYQVSGNKISFFTLHVLPAKLEYRCVRKA